MLVTFSRRQRELASSVPIIIRGTPVEIVSEYIYLGTILDNNLRFSSNTEAILKKCHQRMYLLRKLNSFSVSSKILLTFFQSFIESVLSFSLACWFHSLNLQEKNRLHSIGRVCSKIIGLPTRSLTVVYEQQVRGLAAQIMKNPSHALFPAFERLPSGRRLRCPACRTVRRRSTFVPQAVLLLNSKISEL
ncbi:uncharacterized protein V6R79_009188 [Siganus canaliculatus]